MIVYTVAFCVVPIVFMGYFWLLHVSFWMARRYKERGMSEDDGYSAGLHLAMVTGGIALVGVVVLVVNCTLPIFMNCV